MMTFLPYSNFIKTAKCLDYRRLGKQRIETWQIYQALKQGEYSVCKFCNGQKEFSQNPDIPCPKCRGIGKQKTACYNHPIVKMWKGYEELLLRYGYAICLEWQERGYKDNMLLKFLKAMKIGHSCPDMIKIPHWLGNKKFHASHRSNLLRKNKKYYSKFGWKEKSNLPYYWIKN